MTKRIAVNWHPSVFERLLGRFQGAQDEMEGHGSGVWLPELELAALVDLLRQVTGESAESQVSEDSTPFQAGGAHLEPSRERLDGSSADLTFAHVHEVNRARAARWHPGFPDDAEWSGADWSNAMCGEAGELANVVKKLRRNECGLKGALDLPEADLRRDLAHEIADVFLYLDLLATFYGVDIPKAIVEKFNVVSERQGFPERLP